MSTAPPTPGDPYVVEMVMVDGRPDGIRRVTLDNWTGAAIAFSKFDVSRACKRSDLHLPGVYVLEGPDADDPEADRIYVGEGDVVADRVLSHAGPRGKEFWTRCVAITSEELNKAHVRWLEAELIRLARSSGQSTVENATSPPQPHLSEADHARVRTFLTRVLQLLPILGVSALEGSEDEPVPADGVAVSLSSRGVEGSGIYSSEGLRVHAGSRARLEETASAANSVRASRKRLREAGVLVPDGEQLRFARDHLFASPSGAASALVGGNVNGWDVWHLDDGRRLAEAFAE